MVQRSDLSSTFEGRDPLGDAQRSTRPSTSTSIAQQDVHLLCDSWQIKRVVESPRESRSGRARQAVLSARLPGARVPVRVHAAPRAVVAGEGVSIHYADSYQCVRSSSWIAGEQGHCLAWSGCVIVACSVAFPIASRVLSGWKKSATLAEPCACPVSSLGMILGCFDIYKS